MGKFAKFEDYGGYKVWKLVDGIPKLKFICHL